MGSIIDLRKHQDRRRHEIEREAAVNQIQAFRDAWENMQHLSSPSIVRLFNRAVRLGLVKRSDLPANLRHL